MMQIPSLIAEIENAWWTSTYLSLIREGVSCALNDRLHSELDSESPVPELPSPNVLALHKKWAQLGDSLMWSDGELRRAAGYLLKLLDGGQRTGLCLSGVRMWLHNVKHSADLESDAWQALCAACDEYADLKALCNALAMCRTAVGEVDARLVDALHRLLLVLQSGAAKTRPASVR